MNDQTEAQALCALDATLTEWIAVAQMWLTQGVRPLATRLFYMSDADSDPQRVDFVAYASLFQVQQRRMNAAIHDAQMAIEVDEHRYEPDERGGP